jgi:hypothetical protein
MVTRPQLERATDLAEIVETDDPLGFGFIAGQNGERRN